MNPYRNAWIPPPEPRPRPSLGQRAVDFACGAGYAALTCIAVYAGASVVAACAGSSPQPSAADEAGVAAYAAAQEACIETAKTLEESKACRLAVRAKWGRK